MSNQSGPSEHDQSDSVVKADSDQSQKPPSATPSSQTQQPVQSEPPLTGQSKAEKTLDYLRRLRSRGEFDPTAPLTNDRAREISQKATELAKEEITVSTVKDARNRLLKEPVKRALAPSVTPATQGSEASRPQPKRPPPTEVQPAGPQPTEPAEKPKVPLTPEEVQKNQRFVDRLVTWVLTKAEADAPQEDKAFIIENFNDALTDTNSKVPTVIKVVFAIVMIGYYVAKSIGKIRAKLSKKEEQPKEVEKK